MSTVPFKLLLALALYSSKDLNRISAQECSASGILAGYNTTNQIRNTTEGKRYLLVGAGKLDCYGVIREWIFHTNDGCQSKKSVEFEVWRPMTSGYQLVGVNAFNSSSCGSQNYWVTFGIAPIFRIPVEPGYIIGWNQKQGSLLISSEWPPNSTHLAVNSSNDTTTFDPGDPLTFTFSGSSAYSVMVMLVKGDPPSLDNLPAFVNVTEGDSTNTTVIFTVLASHINNRIYADAVPLSFGLTPTNTPFGMQISTRLNGLAEIYVETGGILDYETQSVYDLSITVTGLGLTTTSTLTVNVIDANEPHNFTNLPSSIDVSAASTSAGDEVFVVIIYDPDLNPVAPVRCYLNKWSSTDTDTDVPPFSIDPDTGSMTANVDLSTWTLKNPTASSYPSTVTYEIGILATEGLHSVPDTLTVRIRDIKQPPAFLNLPGNVSIPESTPPNAIIFTVLTEQSSDQIKYEIVNSFDSLPFCIDGLSGDVSLCSYGKLDACNKSVYSVQIRASNSVHGNTDVLNVTVNLTNSAPAFNQSIYYATINEECNNSSSCMSGQAIATLTVVDRSCSDGNRRCTIIPGPGSEFFHLSNCTELFNVARIELDTHPEYETIELLVEARDSVSLTGHCRVIVNVLNINEHAPQFDEAAYSGWVEENAPGGTTVLTVAATDGDWLNHPNGQFEYSILPEDTIQYQFEVEPKSGIVKTKQPLDSETAPSYSFTVVVTDHGTSPWSLNGSASVVVTVVDVNDHRPQITCDNRPPDEPYPPHQPCFYNYDLVDDVKVGNNVSSVTFVASDLDDGLGNITFHLLVPDNYFNLDSNSGLITVKAAVESYTKYPLYVYASDNGSPALWSRITNVRIDTYSRERQYVDLTVRPTADSFDKTTFLAALSEVTKPWIMKIVSSTTFSPDVQTEIIVTVYALADNSSYCLENFASAKNYVDRDEMLSKLQANIYGDPEDILQSSLFASFPVVKVMPTYANWWLDTVEGIATIVCLSVLGLVFLIILIVALFKCLGLLCFKKKQAVKPIHDWDDKLSTAGSTRSTEQVNVRQRSAQNRKTSVSTVHSVVLDKNL